MSETARKQLLSIVAGSVIVWLVGRIVANRLSHGDEGSDEFQVAAIFGGERFGSHAPHLRSGSLVASMGGH